jgi:hypothetical protein
MKRASKSALLVSALAIATAAHAECPTDKDGASGFAVERSGSSRTEVFHLADGKTRTVGRFTGNLMLEVTHYAGLVQLERIDRGKRTVYKPISDLKGLDKLKVGHTVVTTFEQTDPANQVSRRRIELKATVADKLGIGACTYDVLKIEERLANADVPFGGKPGILYWSPALKMILARGLVEANGAERINKFDRIEKLKR